MEKFDNRKLKRIARELARKHNFELVILFGSYARGEQNK